VITECPTPTKNRPQRITAGPDGNVWFTEPDLHLLARITPSGTITEFPLLTGIGLYDITRGPDGNMWFAEEFGRLGRITPGGVVKEFPIPGFPDGNVVGITAGPDGNIWYCDYQRGQIGRIVP
jgi:virginiamycin B lyase